jgi:branched-chain amino acid aminotransferase
VAGIRSGEVTEAIACGTAAVLTGIRSFRLESSGENIALAAAPGPVTKAIYERLVDIQFGRYPDTHNWLTPVCKL